MYFPFLVHGTNIPWENGHRSKIIWNIGPMEGQKLQARTIFPWNIGPPDQFPVTGRFEAEHNQHHRFAVGVWFILLTLIIQRK